MVNTIPAMTKRYVETSGVVSGTALSERVEVVEDEARVGSRTKVDRGREVDRREVKARDGSDLTSEEILLKERGRVYDSRFEKPSVSVFTFPSTRRKNCSLPRSNYTSCAKISADWEYQTALIY